MTPVGKLTVDIRTEKPEPILPALLSVAMMVSPNTPADKAVNDPVGTGPHKLNTFTPQTVVLDRFDGYWGKTPDIAKATYVWRAESSLRAAWSRRERPSSHRRSPSRTPTTRKRTSPT